MKRQLARVIFPIDLDVTIYDDNMGVIDLLIYEGVEDNFSIDRVVNEAINYVNDTHPSAKYMKVCRQNSSNPIGALSHNLNTKNNQGRYKPRWYEV